MGTGTDVAILIVPPDALGAASSLPGPLSCIAPRQVVGFVMSLRKFCEWGSGGGWSSRLGWGKLSRPPVALDDPTPAHAGQGVHWRQVTTAASGRYMVAGAPRGVSRRWLAFRDLGQAFEDPSDVPARNHGPDVTITESLSPDAERQQGPDVRKASLAEPGVAVEHP